MLQDNSQPIKCVGNPNEAQCEDVKDAGNDRSYAPKERKLSVLKELCQGHSYQANKRNQAHFIKRTNYVAQP